MIDRLLSIICWWTHHNWLAINKNELWCTVCHKTAPRPCACIVVKPAVVQQSSVDFEAMEPEEFAAHMRSLGVDIKVHV